MWLPVSLKLTPLSLLFPSFMPFGALQAETVLVDTTQTHLCGPNATLN